MTAAIDDPVRLTFAELEYLLKGADSWPAARAAFGLQELGDEGLAAGLSSLTIRGLLNWSGESGIAMDNVRRAVAAVAAAEQWLTIVSRDMQGMSASYLGVSTDRSVRVLVTATAPGCYRLDALVDGPDASLQAAALAHATVADSTPSIVALSYGSAGRVRRLKIGRDPAGHWFADSGDSASADGLEQSSEPDVTATLTRFLGDLYRT